MSETTTETTADDFDLHATPAGDALIGQLLPPSPDAGEPTPGVLMIGKTVKSVGDGVIVFTDGSRVGVAANARAGVPYIAFTELEPTPGATRMAEGMAGVDRDAAAKAGASEWDSKYCYLLAKFTNEASKDAMSGAAVNARVALSSFMLDSLATLTADRDAAVRERDGMRAIIQQSLRAAPVGNVTKHTPEYLPLIIRDLANEVGELSHDNDSLASQLAAAREALQAMRDEVQRHENHYADFPGEHPCGWSWDFSAVDAALSPAQPPAPRTAEEGSDPANAGKDEGER